MLSEKEKQAIEELKEDIKDMEENEEIIHIPLFKYEAKILLNLIEKLQKEKEEYRINWCNKGEEVERLKKIIYENIIIEPDENGCYEELNIHISDYIPKKVIKDKIEELERFIYKGKNAPQDFLQYRVKAKIQVLKELLGE